MPQADRTLDRARLRADARGRLFGLRGRDEVGAEVELTAAVFDGSGRYDAEGSRRAPGRLWEALAGADPMPWRGGALTREPGGQVEFSGPTWPTAERAAVGMDAAVRALGRSARRLGIELMGVGYHPWATAEEVGLRKRTPRYAAMQEAFDRIGPYGRRMMRLTGSLQVALDLGEGPAECRERWELAQRLAPVLGAAFSHSAIERGHPADRAGLRGQTWLELDPSRTGFPRLFLGDPHVDPAEAYIDFALGASVLFVSRGGGDAGPLRVPDRGLTFGEWLDGGQPEGYPDLDDWKTHLSTLFPEVRVRGYLEVRSADVPGRSWVGVPVLVAATAIRDAAIRRALLDRWRPSHAALEGWRRRASGAGLGDEGLREEARLLFGLVRGRLGGAAERLVAAYDERFVQEGASPGEVAARGIAVGETLDLDGLRAVERCRTGSAVG